ncbi:hypothetical protein [Tabrizicola sp. YIM 78059]|uniref:hypothetical protein n=1 Tax=Tabrizicola sp. YIM 78059 TaxID=2529861 RepID=UPI0010A9BE5B|nr:hypothetical protein [Tabrizicola sp. YIM 78059]
MLRLLGFLLFVAVGGGGLLFIDYNNARNAAAARGDQALTLAAYLETVTDRIGNATALAGVAGMSRSLEQMLPAAPDGWTVRAAATEDLADFLPKKGAKVDRKARDQVAAVGSTKAVNGAEVVIRTYERGDRRVVIQAIRYPDRIFTDPDAAEERFRLRIEAAERRGRPFMTVRGLDIAEEFPGEGIRARYFSANVGGQIQIRVLATKRMKDKELIPFFETLHVQAMNAAVVDKVEGLGEVPVILLVSAMKANEREAYEADRARRSEEAVMLARSLREADAARAGSVRKPAAKPTEGFAADCTKGAGGIKRCSVASGD